jgi:DNA-binding NtrC family response regulator
MPGRILIIDDDAGFARALAKNLRNSGHDIATCGTAAEARESFGSANADVVVLDYHLPDADGLALLDELRPNAAGAVFLVVTAYPNIDIAVDAMRRGAFDFVAKDADLRECILRIERGAEVGLLRRRMAEASYGGSALEGGHELIGTSAPMRALRARLAALEGADDTTVLIHGETGTGKGVVARWVHSRSGRAYEPFVAVDCTTIPATLVESELFGHERGAFSGATDTKIGRVGAAGSGTLFLDEIGELELPMQVKLLRLLEEREFTRIGSTRAREMRARIVTATNRDLDKMISEGQFRADLRYRLEVFVIHVPPLRDRGDDVFRLTAHFAAERSRALGRGTPRIAPAVVEALGRYSFPGNVRELRNMVEQAVLLSEDPKELALEDFPVLTRAPARRSAPRDDEAPRLVDASLDQIRARHARRERSDIARALEETGGNVTKAARELGMSRYGLLRRLQKYEMK